jgi:hypothetical protein
MNEPRSDSYSDDEIARRRDEALRRALSTPPQPKHGKVKESKQPKDAPPEVAKGVGRDV